MEAICYICNKTTTNCNQNLNEIKSKHSSTPIAEFVAKLLAEYETDRNLYHPSNCICSECLSKIYSYDWTCVKAKEQESELRSLLMQTESVIKSRLDGHIDDNTTDRTSTFRRRSNPLNGVVQIIDDEDYNDGERTDDKASVKVAMQKFAVTKAAAATPFLDSIVHDTSMVKIKKSTSNDDIKPDPSTMWDVKPTIETLTSTLLQPQQQQPQQQQLNNGLTKVEPPKKGKPIIVRVVKRVPFLKSNPPNASASQHSASITSPSSGTSSATVTADAMARRIVSKPVATTSPAKKVTAMRKQTKTTVDPLICKYCDARYPNVKILQNHLKLHTKYSGSITCHICFYHMNVDKESFKAHVKKHSKVPPNHCVLCSEGDAENFDLRQHVQTVHFDANLLCDYCGKTFSYSSQLYKHRRTHFDVRHEQCPHCPKTFKFRRSLKDHMNTHLNTEPAFACAFCDRRFKRKDHCRVHEKRHRGDVKKFKCTLCPAAFEYKHDFNMHLQRKHDAELPHDKRR